MDYTTHVNVALTHKTSNENMRSFGEAALILTNTIKSAIIRELVHPECQLITTGLRRLSGAVCHISPSETDGTSGKASLYIRRHAWDRTIVMGDLDKRHKQ